VLYTLDMVGRVHSQIKYITHTASRVCRQNTIFYLCTWLAVYVIYLIWLCTWLAECTASFKSISN